MDEELLSLAWMLLETHWPLPRRQAQPKTTSAKTEVEHQQTTTLSSAFMFLHKWRRVGGV